MASSDNDLIMTGAVTTVVSGPGDVFSLQTLLPTTTVATTSTIYLSQFYHSAFATVCGGYSSCCAVVIVEIQLWLCVFVSQSN